MAIQIVTDQIAAQQVTSAKIASSTITATQMAMNGTFNYTGALQVGGAVVASQAYVDSAIAGLHWKEACKVATTANLAATYANGSSGVGATLTADSNGAISIDGLTLSVDDRVLVKDMSSGSQNGIYKVTTAGSASAAYVLTRTTDADTAAELTSAAVFVSSGTVNSDIAFTQTADSITVGTTALVWTKFSGTSAIVAGDGITKAGNTLSLNLNGLAGAVLSVSADSIPFIDGSGNNKKESIVDLASAMAGSGLAASNGQFALSNNAVTVAAGTGLSGGGSIALGASGSLALDLNGLPAATISLANDSVAIIDADGNASSKESWADVASAMAGSGITATSGVLSLTQSAVTISAGVGLSGGGSVSLGGSASLAIDFNELSAVPSIDLANDLLCVIDATDDSSKKLTFVNLATAMAGSGISASNGVLALTNSSVTVSSGAGLSGGGAIALGGSSVLSLSLDGLSAAAVNVANDSIAIIDADDSNASKKESIADLCTAMAGAGLNGVGGQFSIAPNGVGASELANNAVDAAAIADDAVTIAKIGARPYTESFQGNAGASYDLARAVDASWVDRVQVYRNGLRCKKVSSGPADESEYTVSATGGTGGVCQITFGAAPNTDTIIVDYMT
jgi:hypothetical protein